jgi:hypothetical protein
MKRLLLAAALLAGTVACEPEYAESARAAGGGDHAPGAAEGAAEPGEHPDVVGGADPTAVSGRVRGDSGTIHHPAADGNSGRPSDGRGD